MTHTKNLIVQWLYDRGIAQNGTQLGQAVKLMEEATEVLDAINLQDHNNLMLEIGDVFITLVAISEVSGIDIEECIERAYNKIKDRVGYLREDGVFMKQTVTEFE